jgi:hypothetical protein
MRKTLDHYKLSCKEQRLELTKLQMQKVRLKALVDNFQNNNEEYIKIRNTVEEKVHNILSDRKMLLKLALLSLTESMRKDPDKYSTLIFNNTSSSTTSAADYNSQYHAISYGHQQYTSQDYPIEAYTSMLLEEAEKLYDKLAKELVDESISDYAYNILSSLPLLPPANEEQQGHPRQTTAANQSYMHTEEHKFIRSEIDNDG